MNSEPRPAPLPITYLTRQIEDAHHALRDDLQAANSRIGELERENDRIRTVLLQVLDAPNYCQCDVITSGRACAYCHGRKLIFGDERGGRQ